MKVHAGVDKDSGLIQSVVDGDACHQSIAKRPEMAGKTTEFRVAMRPGKRRASPDTPDGKLQLLIETAKALIRWMKVDTSGMQLSVWLHQP